MINLIKKLFNRKQQKKKFKIYYYRQGPNNEKFLGVEVGPKPTDPDEIDDAYQASYAKWHNWRKENNKKKRPVSAVHNYFWNHTYSGEMMFELIDSLSDRQILQMNGIGAGGLKIARAVSAWSKE